MRVLYRGTLAVIRGLCFYGLMKNKLVRGTKEQAESDPHGLAMEKLSPNSAVV